jgi:hypothetical protein
MGAAANELDELLLHWQAGYGDSPSARANGVRQQTQNKAMPTSLAGLIYGTISVAALLAAESARSETYPKTVGAVGILTILYWIAHSYAEFTAERIQEHEPFTYRGLLLNATRELTVLIGAAIPFFEILVFWAVGASLTTAIASASWTSAGIVAAIEIVIGVRADLKGRELVRQTTVGAVLGLLIVALRVLLH